MARRLNCSICADCRFKSDLPPVPESLQIRQQTSNLVLLTWRNGRRDNASSFSDDEDVRYLVEERHLVGPRYLESRLSPWAVCHVSTKPHATLRSRLKSGHWYQFRVAAVNGNGSRGYSQISRPFKTKGERAFGRRILRPFNNNINNKNRYNKVTSSVFFLFNEDDRGPQYAN